LGKSNPKLLEQVAKISAETAVQTAIEYLEQEKQKQKKMKRDRRLRNIKLLLRNYRSFTVHCEGIKVGLDRLNNMLQIDDLETDEAAIESIKRSKERTLAIVKFIDQMLEVYKVLSERSEKPEDLRQYQTIYKMYIASEKYSAEKIAECHKVDVRTVYRDINSACETLSGLIFGADFIRFDI